ncbi:uncharacterized protein [Ptychodera flava]|uniref:uncharacterized protein n=1 Tax=Ptychodera flava TaxID=63121 RepID=UPI003969EA89
MTTLPRIAPPETPTAVSAPVSSPPSMNVSKPKSKSASAALPAATITVNGKPLPPSVWARVSYTTADLGNLRPHQFPRINPLRPVRDRRTVSLETTGAHHVIEQRTLAMKQREHYRYHSGWEKPFYGSPAEKETYRRDIRSKLKEQMSDRILLEKQLLRDKVQESKQAVEYDRQCIESDRADIMKKAAHLRQFRDENKKLMEWKEHQDRLNRLLQNKYEQELIRYNPINWSHSLT